MRETGYNASKPKKTAKPSNPEFRGSFPPVAKTAKKSVAKKATAPRWKNPDWARAVNKPARYTGPDAAKAGNASRLAVGSTTRKSVTVKDSRPGATGGSVTFKSSSVNSKPKPKVKSAAMKAAEKIVPKGSSNFMTNAPIAAKPKTTPKAKGPATKITAEAKKKVASAASWRY